jgi:hypothetical protein
MHAVNSPKKKTNLLTIKVNPFDRRGKAICGKAGVHGDKRRLARVNERVAWKRNQP